MELQGFSQDLDIIYGFMYIQFTLGVNSIQRKKVQNFSKYPNRHFILKSKSNNGSCSITILDGLFLCHFLYWLIRMISYSAIKALFCMANLERFVSFHYIRLIKIMHNLDGPNRTFSHFQVNLLRDQIAIWSIGSQYRVTKFKPPF